MTAPLSEETTAHLFSQAIAFERRAARLYAELSKLFSHQPDVAAFWERMQNDERSHAKTLEHIKDRLSADELSSEAAKPMLTKVIDVHRLFDEDLIGPVTNLADAYNLAHRMEDSEMNAIFTFLTSRFLISDERKDILTSQIDEHLDLLTRFSQQFRTDPAMRLIPARHDIPKQTS